MTVYTIILHFERQARENTETSKVDGTIELHHAYFCLILQKFTNGTKVRKQCT